MPITSLRDVCEGCGTELDRYGHHRTTCMRTGRVQGRHRHLVSAWRRVFAEAGVNIPDRNVERMLRSTHFRRNESDSRRLDLVTPGIPSVFGGAPVFVDATLVSPVRGTGVPMPRAAAVDGAALQAAERRNREVDYPEVEEAADAQLVCLGCETFGRQSKHSLVLVRQLARNTAAGYMPALRAAVQYACMSGWWALLGTAVQREVAVSCLRPAGADLLPALSLSSLPLADWLDMHR